jgi:pimeloyl-ACP methyl ester carboxylesterase
MVTDVFDVPGMHVTDHAFELPLDHARPDGPAITVFARELVASERRNDDGPVLVYFQGGPGFSSPRPTDASGWIGAALKEFRVLLLDQRGTGKSSPITAQTIGEIGDDALQAAYLSHFRADAIVSDAEAIRRELLGDERRWSILGQSFGGFCALRYLSAAPEGLGRVLITGGLATLERPADDVYRATYRRLRARNDAYYARYTRDRQGWTDVAAYLAEHDVRFPDGERLTVERLQFLGMDLGRSDGFESLHFLLEGAFVTLRGGRRLAEPFVREVYRRQDFVASPLFAVLHEPIYAQERATRWAAQRLLEEAPEVPYVPGKALRFTGEMIYPWMFEQYPGLRPFAGAADRVAAKDDWPRLYDPERLAANEVPVAALAYLDDMYVDYDYSRETAAAVRGLRLWSTDEYQHNGLLADGERILERLLAMTRGPV